MSKATILLLLKKTLIVFIVFLSLYLLMNLLGSHTRKVDQSKDSEKNLIILLHENLLQVSELQNLHPDQTSIGYDISTLRESIQKNIDNISKLAKDKKLIKNNPKLAKNADEITKQETGLLSDFDDTYNLYRKLLQYSPGSDLGDLSAKNNPDNIKTRIDATTEALTKIASGSQTRQISDGVASAEVLQVPDDIKVQIREANTCIGQVKDMLSTADEQAIKKHVQTCDNQYKRLRESAAKEVISRTNTEDFKTFTSNLGKLVQ